MSILGSKGQNHCIPMLPVEYLGPILFITGYRAVLSSVQTPSGAINLIFLLAHQPSFIMRVRTYPKLWGRSCQSPDKQRYNVEISKVHRV